MTGTHKTQKKGGELRYMGSRADICKYPPLRFLRQKRQNLRILGIGTDLERRVVFGDLHGELVRDGGSVVLQGHQAEVGQAGTV